MKRSIILLSTTAAGFISAGLADKGIWIPSMLCLIWPVLVLIGNVMKKPRAATRGKSKVETQILDFYSTTATIRAQAKTWTPAGKMLMPVNYEE